MSGNYLRILHDVKYKQKILSYYSHILRCKKKIAQNRLRQKKDNTASGKLVLVFNLRKEHFIVKTV